MNKKINWISELDKFITNYFKEVAPFEIDNIPIPTEFYVGSIDNKSISEILTENGDIKYPLLIISKDLSSNSFVLTKERNAPHSESTRITFRQFVKDKYINNEANNINVEIYRYFPPVYFKCNYQITLFCESMKHANEFQMQFLDRVNQSYYPIKSERFKSSFFDVLWFVKDGGQVNDNYTEGNVKKRELKVIIQLEGSGYFMSLDNSQIIRGINSLTLDKILR